VVDVIIFKHVFISMMVGILKAASLVALAALTKYSSGHRIVRKSTLKRSRVFKTVDFDGNADLGQFSRWLQSREILRRVDPKRASTTFRLNGVKFRLHRGSRKNVESAIAEDERAFHADSEILGAISGGGFGENLEWEVQKIQTRMPLCPDSAL
jgi:hypothetical protein